MSCDRETETDFPDRMLNAFAGTIDNVDLTGSHATAPLRMCPKAPDRESDTRWTDCVVAGTAARALVPAAPNPDRGNRATHGPQDQAGRGHWGLAETANTVAGQEKKGVQELFPS
jgi:hypothetical protein